MRQFARFSVALRLQHYYCSEPAAVERRLVYVQTLMLSWTLNGPHASITQQGGGSKFPAGRKLYRSTVPDSPTELFY